MTDSLSIYRKADRLVSRFGTRDPELIAKGSGIVIYDILDTDELLGMYCVRWRKRMILLNQRLETHMRTNVIAHELGHDQEHRQLAKSGLQEFNLFNMQSRTEYEANAFASHILLDTDEVLSYARNGYDVVQIAQAMDTNINMVLIKVSEMNNLGYSLRMPMEADPTFLKDISPECGRTDE